MICAMGIGSTVHIVQIRSFVFSKTCVFLRLIRCDITTFFISTHFTFNIINLSFLTDTWNLSNFRTVDGQTFTIQLEFELKLKFADFLLSFNLNFIGAQYNERVKKNSNSNKLQQHRNIA